jgi:hypothetical protein
LLLAQGIEKALEAAFMMIIMAVAFLVVSIIPTIECMPFVLS